MSGESLVSRWVTACWIWILQMHARSRQCNARLAAAGQGKRTRRGLTLNFASIATSPSGMGTAKGLGRTDSST